MNIWQFLDKQLARISPSGVAGAGIFLLTYWVLDMLAKDRTLADNDLFKTLSQAIIVQGLIGLAMAAWFTKNSGTSRTEITNTPANPVPTDPQPQENTDASNSR